MKYKLTSDLSSIQYKAWEYAGGAPSSEYYPPAIEVEVCQTLDANGNPPNNQKYIKFLYSRKFKPYSLFKSGFHFNIRSIKANKSDALFVKTDVLSASNVTSDLISATAISVTDKIDSDSICVDSITSTTNASSKIGIVTDICGGLLKYDNFQFGEVLANTISGLNGDITNITANGITSTNGDFGAVGTQNISIQKMISSSYVSSGRHIGEVEKVFLTSDEGQFSELSAGGLVCFKSPDYKPAITSDVNDPNITGKLWDFEHERKGQPAYWAANGVMSDTMNINTSGTIDAIRIFNGNPTSGSKKSMVLFGRTKVWIKGKFNRFDRLINAADNDHTFNIGFAKKREPTDIGKPIIGIVLENTSSNDDNSKKFVECIVDFNVLEYRKSDS